jgi:hypothetical protein
LTPQQTNDDAAKTGRSQRPSLVFTAALLLISLASAIPRILLGRSEFIEYDGYWHAFIAQQDTWSRFWADVYFNVHPPLFFLLLKAAMWFGRTPLIYRSISIASGVGSVFLVGWIARKITGSSARACQSALAFGFAMAAIIISCAVRSYSLSVFFVLASFSCLLDILREDSSRIAWKARAGFAIWTILACLSEYFAFFYAGAAILLLAGRLAARNVRGRQPQWSTGVMTIAPVVATIAIVFAVWATIASFSAYFALVYAAAAALVLAGWLAVRAEYRSEAITLAPVIATIAILYGTHAGALATIQNHIPDYYYDPRTRESVVAFVLRNSRNFLRLFLPFDISNAIVVLGIGLFAIAVGLVTVRAIRGWPPTTRLAARGTFFITAITLLAIIAAALAGKYPYGGELRQQFLLFPFLVLCLAVAVERAAQSLGNVVPPGGRVAANICLAAIAAGAGVAQYLRYPVSSTNEFTSEMAAFDRFESSPAAVYLDQFNLIGFFMFHQDWSWKLDHRQPIAGIDVYHIRKGNKQMVVLRDLNTWNADPNEAPLFTTLAQSLEAENMPSLSVFDVRQAEYKGKFANIHEVQSKTLQAASTAAMCIDRMDVNPNWWYVTFKRSGCKPRELPHDEVTAEAAIGNAVDDSNKAIAYIGKWEHGKFAQARDASLSYSNDAGASARATFEGTQITWVHSKAVNRGIAEVRIDGVSKGKIDLYSATTIWRTEDTFKTFGPGAHTFEVLVTEDRNPLATDHFADVDALIVK